MRTIVSALLFLAVCTVAVAADVEIPNRLPQAKVGEWILMVDTSDAHSGEKVKFTATEVRDDGVVVLKREHFTAEGTVDDSKDMEIPLERYAERLAGLKDKAKQISFERLWIKDKEMPVVAVVWDDDKGEDGATREFKMWVSEELPLGGVAKFWSSDPEIPSAEIVDYGF